ncbi:MAG: hypothetical protein DRJ37_05680 [Thermoprotei archaeon]|nr:MAG: hypothetical protein DRJ37_05680 [Thermoprotei archaeon]
MELLIEVAFVLMLGLPGIALVGLLRELGLIDDISVVDTLAAGWLLWIACLVLPFTVAAAAWPKVNIPLLFWGHLLLGLGVLISYVLLLCHRYPLAELASRILMPRLLGSPVALPLLIMLAYYAFVAYAIPVYYSYDAVAYYLPYAQAILRHSGLAWDYRSAFLHYGWGWVNPPSVVLLYAYAMFFFRGLPAFKLLPLLYLLMVLAAVYGIAKLLLDDEEVALASVSLALAIPSLFIYIANTSYNLDLGLAAYYLLTMYALLRFLLTRRPWWAFISSVGLSLTMLTTRYSFVYALPFLIVLSQAFRGRIRRLIPGLTLVLICSAEAVRYIDALLVATRPLELIKSLAAVILNLVIMTLLFFMIPRLHDDVGSLRFPQDLRCLKPMFPVLAVLSWFVLQIRRTGSPFFPFPTFLFLRPDLAKDLAWAMKMGQQIRPLGAALPPEEIALAIPRFFVAPIMGCLPAICGWMAFVELYLRRRAKTGWKDKQMLLIYLFLIGLLMWLWETHGNLYESRHLLHPACATAIVAAFGMTSLLRRLGITRTGAPMAFFSSLLFCHLQLNYVAFEVDDFVVWRPWMSLTPDILVFSGVLAITIASSHEMFKKPMISRLAMLVASALLILVVSTPVMCTLSAIRAHGWDVCEWRWTIASRRQWDKVDVIEYFRSHPVDSIIVAFDAHTLAYYADVEVIRLDLPFGLIVLRDILLSDNEEWIAHRLRELGIEYVLVPNEHHHLYQAYLKLSNTTFISMLYEGEYFIKVRDFKYYELHRLRPTPGG